MLVAVLVFVLLAIVSGLIYDAVKRGAVWLKPYGVHWTARLIFGAAIRLLPERDRERYNEEWAAEFGADLSFSEAVRLARAAIGLRRVDSSKAPGEESPPAEVATDLEDGTPGVEVLSPARLLLLTEKAAAEAAFVAEELQMLIDRVPSIEPVSRARVMLASDRLDAISRALMLELRDPDGPGGDRLVGLGTYGLASIEEFDAKEPRLYRRTRMTLAKAALAAVLGGVATGVAAGLALPPIAPPGDA